WPSCSAKQRPDRLWHRPQSRCMRRRNSSRLSAERIASSEDRRLGIREDLIRNWKRAAKERGAEAFPGRGDLPPAEDEFRRLRAEVARLKAERDLLTKAAAYFAGPPT